MVTYTYFTVTENGKHFYNSEVFETDTRPNQTLAALCICSSNNQGFYRTIEVEMALQVNFNNHDAHTSTYLNTLATRGLVEKISLNSEQRDRILNLCDSSVSKSRISEILDTPLKLIELIVTENKPNGLNSLVNSFSQSADRKI